MAESDYILQVKDLKQYFYPDRKHVVKAVDGVSFRVRRGSTFGLVGESGSGKSTIGKALIRLNDPTAGSILFDGEEIAGKLTRDLRRHITGKMQMIFQDPMASLNPKKKIIDIVAEGLDANHLYKSREERTELVCSMLECVGLSREFANRYPHMFSGGQRQRVGIARAIIMNPRGDHRRRVHLGAGRVHSGPGGQPAQGSAGGAKADLHLHRPRPVHGQVHLRLYRRAASGPHGGNGHQGRYL